MEKETTSIRLKKIMSIKGLKQVDILELCKPYCEKYNEKLNKSHLSQYVKGTNEPNQRKLVILAKALNVSEAWLMGLDVPMQKEVSIDNPELDAKISNDKELKRVIEKYYQLPIDIQEAVLNMLDSLIDFKLK